MTSHRELSWILPEEIYLWADATEGNGHVQKLSLNLRDLHFGYNDDFFFWLISFFISQRMLMGKHKTRICFSLSLFFFPRDDCSFALIVIYFFFASAFQNTFCLMRTWCGKQTWYGLNSKHLWWACNVEQSVVSATVPLTLQHGNSKTKTGRCRTTKDSQGGY